MVSKIAFCRQMVVNVHLISVMLRSSIQLYRNAYSGLPPSMWWLSLVMFINRCGTMVIPFLTVYLTSRGYSLAEAGGVMAAFGAGSIVGGYLGGRLTDRYGHFAIQVSSLLLNGILFIVLGYMEGLIQITVCIFILSSLGESFRPANSAAIAQYSNENNRTRCYALNRLAINAGWAIGPAVGGLLAHKDYALLFWTDGLTCIAASLLLFAVFYKNSGGVSWKKKELKPVSRSAYRDKPFLLGMLYIFLVGLCFFQMFSILPVFYKEVIGLDETQIGWLLAMNGIIIVLVEMVLVYKLEPKGRAVQYMMQGAFVIGVSFLLLASKAVAVIAVSSMVMVTFGEMLLFPFMNNFWVRRCDETNRGQYAGIYTMSFSAAIVLAPSFASQVASRAGFNTLWVVNFIICGLGAAGFYFLKKRVSNERV